MNREKFNTLDIQYQVTYFNKELQKGTNNFNAICKGIGISKNTVLSRFKKFGYEPAREGQKISEFLHGGEKDIEKLTEQNYLIEKKKTKANDPYEMNVILKRIELLEQKIKALENGDIRSHKNFINTYENTLAKTFKIGVASGKCGFHTLRAFSMLIPMV